MTTTDRQSEKRGVVCNFAEPTKECVKGARAYVILLNVGNASERVYLLARSRGGRLIRKWEDARRLTNFRLTTIMAAEGEPFDVAWSEPNAQEWCDEMNQRGMP